MKFTDSVIV